MADKAAGAGAEGADLLGVLALGIPEQLRHRDSAAPGGGHGALAPDDVGSVNHPAVLVGGNGDPPADVADDIALRLIALPLAFGVAQGGLLEVQGVEMDVPVNALDAGDTGQVAELVGVRGVHHKGGFPILCGKLVSQLAPQVGGMLHPVGPPAGMVQQGVPYPVDAPLHGHQPAAPAHKGVRGGKVDVVLFQQVGDGLPAVGELVADGGVFL